MERFEILRRSIVQIESNGLVVQHESFTIDQRTTETTGIARIFAFNTYQSLVADAVRLWQAVTLTNFCWQLSETNRDPVSRPLCSSRSARRRKPSSLPVE
jgi:hypothetical protein